MYLKVLVEFCVKLLRNERLDDFTSSSGCEMAALVLLFFFHLILDIRSQNVPQLLVSPEVLTERGSVELHCSVPHNVKVSRCSFYPEGDDTNIKPSPSPSCRLSVAGSDLIRWTGRSSPGTLRIICFYVLDNSVRSPSPHSRPAPVTVLRKINITTPIPKQLGQNTNYFFRETSQRPTTKPSPTGFSSPSTTSSTTKEKTRAESHGPSTPTTDRKKPTAGSLSVLLPSVLGVCVLLAGMMSVCLCSFIRKQAAERRKMDLTQDGDEIYTEVMYTLSSQRKRGSFQLPLNDGP
ncbi:uncharacterized protein LOC132873979 isoform X2 [Neoarius graeffei]|uniref:uncharacterized protein LOC132873979 isoform X2 n=1 Tax=Neoarius graeffei TaxID=443677 RepID=UPI00298D1B06|nr:uncharacterized protein LOC132873979 isoform X2 [Neoarius graeffei]